ncbi:unnamed protein product [Adineta steineri]|uniref:F-box domain-containing protein n=1 Tax=Adineta steineri TaxID=433720 RepID=A0A819KPJ3_9BILA|nr:unnamed protein product [Adineta steineri]
MSSVRLRQMTRLQSITFIGINELQLNNMFKRIHLNFLTSFTLHIEKYDDRRKKTTLNFLSSIMAQSNLRKVELNIRNDRISEISWPLHCRIEHLIINENITFDNLCKILSSASQLRKLILKQDLPTMIDHRKLTSTFPQITSLTIEQLDVPIDRLESLLMLTPSLIYLKLIGKECVTDGKRWEQFIQINLPHLDKFHFFMDIKKPIGQTREDLQIILDSFRSSFWTKYKKWFIAGVFNINRPHNIQLYTIPICKSTLKYELDSEKIFVYTSLDISPSLTEHINELNLSLKMQIHDNTIPKQLLLRINPLFPKVTKLQIEFEYKPSLKSMEYFRSLIDVSQLVEVTLTKHYFNKSDEILLCEIVHFIERSPNLTSLTIHSSYCKYEMYPFLDNICSIIPRQIKYLQLAVNKLDQIEMILDRCQYLSVVKFETTRLKLSAEIIHWFTENTIDSTVTRQNGCNVVWIGKRKSPMIFNHKRIKLSDD